MTKRLKIAPLAGLFAGLLAGQMQRIHWRLHHLQGKTITRAHVSIILTPSIVKYTHAHVGVPLQVVQPLQTRTPARSKHVQGYARAPASPAIHYLLKNNDKGIGGYA